MKLLDPDLNSQVWDFIISGGFFMACIIVCSLIAMAVAVHRGFSLRWGAVIPKELEGSDSPAERIVGVAKDRHYTTREEATAAVEAHARDEIVKLESGIPTLEVIIAIAPMLGLLGTVSGLVSVFDVLGESGSADIADPAKMAPGIATALTTTIAGLAVAVPVVIVTSFFTKRIEALAARLEILSNTVLQDRFHAGADRPLTTTLPDLDS